MNDVEDVGILAEVEYVGTTVLTIQEAVVVYVLVTLLLISTQLQRVCNNVSYSG
jgi:hypothetical protein